MSLVVCPLPEALETPVVSNCPVLFDQIVRLVFQRVGQTTFTTVTAKLLATWTPLLAGDDSTKVVLSPLFAELVLPQSESLTAGGNDNTTFNGIPDYNGQGFVAVTAQIRGLNAAAKKSLKTYEAESQANAVGATNLEVQLINRFGQAIADNPSGTVLRGFKCYNFAISTVGSEGLNSKNKHRISFVLAPDWDDNAIVYKPTDFDLLTLQNA